MLCFSSLLVRANWQSRRFHPTSGGFAFFAASHISHKAELKSRCLGRISGPGMLPLNLAPASVGAFVLERPGQPLCLFMEAD
jgi:hypothetical protein